MPLYWTNSDTKYAILCASAPAGTAVLASLYAAKDQSIANFLKGQSFAKKMAPSCQYFYMGMNGVAAAPFGYASYLVYKIGGGFDYTDTTIAMSLYGVTIALGIGAFIPLKKKNIKYLALHNIALATLAASTSIAFYNIDKISGYWTIPFSVWTLYYAFITMKAAGYLGKTAADE